MTLIHHEIVDGPSKFDLMLALFDRDGKHPRRVIFKFDQEAIEKRDGRKYPPLGADVSIDSIKLVNSTKEEWLFTGFYMGGQYGMVRGIFSTQTRKGWIDTGKPKEFEPQLKVTIKPADEKSCAHIFISLDGEIKDIVSAEISYNEGSNPFVDFNKAPR